MRRSALLAGLLVAGCGGKVPCGICYEDEWSREPFPGQEKVYSPTIDMRETTEKGEK